MENVVVNDTFTVVTRYRFFEEGVEKVEEDSTEEVNNNPTTTATITEIVDHEEEEDNCFRGPRKQPPEVQRRVKALLKNQLKFSAMRADLARKVQLLEMQFVKDMKPLEKERQAIISGAYEPTDEECDITGIPDTGIEADDEDDDDEMKQGTNVTVDLQTSMEKMAIGEDPKNEGAEGGAGAVVGEDKKGKGTGVPNFWREVLQGSSVVGPLIEDDDLPILEYLEDITLEMSNLDSVQKQRIMLSFHFGTNPFFTNKVISKAFYTKCCVNQESPLSLVEKAYCESSWATTIDWICEQSVTTRVIRRKIRNTRGEIRHVVSTVEKPSFFNFFKSDEYSDSGTMLQESKEDLEENFMVGEHIRNRIIPAAAFYYSHPDDFEKVDEDSSDDEEIEIISVRKFKRGRDGRRLSAYLPMRTSPVDDDQFGLGTPE